MPSGVHYIPLVTTVVAVIFAPIVFRRWQEKRPAPHLWWWSLGIALYGVGTLTESLTTLFGWNEWVFRSWYVSGALLGGAPLAQGTAYLLLSRRKAHAFSAILLTVVTCASVFVWLTPIQHDLVESHRLTGAVMQWQWVRGFSPFINIYAFILLVGGAAWSAWEFRLSDAHRHRFVGNLLIAVGALLPGIGGTATRFGHTEVLYVTELAGLCLIWLGYRANISPAKVGLPEASERGPIPAS